MSFRYIGHQQKCKKLFHMSYDNEEKTKEAGFTEFMINNCKDILNLYKKHVLSLKTGNIKECINEMITYIAQNVFPILDKYKDKNSVIKCFEVLPSNIRNGKKNIVLNNSNLANVQFTLYLSNGCGLFFNCAAIAFFEIACLA